MTTYGPPNFLQNRAALRRTSRLRWVIVCLIVAGIGGLCAAQDYPEGKRFSSKKFYDGLKERGLTDLLELHLREHPPENDLDALLLSRDIKLAEFADPSLSPDARSDAIAEANRILQDIIEQYPGDDRSVAWRLELARSLMYTEADRHTSSLLYRGGTSDDRARLRALMERAVSVLGDLSWRLNRRYENLDNLSAPEYDRLEQSGEIEKIEQNIALTDYLLAWARFYHASALDADDASRVQELNDVLDYLVNRSSLLDTPHRVTHYQAQALLLAGMADRRLDRQLSSRTRLARAIDVASDVQDRAERAELDWVTTLARIELVRGFVDAGDFSTAVEAIGLFHKQLNRSGRPPFAKALILGLLERSVYSAWADRLESTGQTAEANRRRREGIRSLQELAARDVTYRDEVYVALYDVLASVDQPETLSPFSRCALVAGSLTEADRLMERLNALRTDGASPTDGAVMELEERRASLLDRAISVAQSVQSGSGDANAPLRAEAVFNMGVALYRRGRILDAASAFKEVASSAPAFDRSLDAATFAVQLGWELRQDSALAARDDVTLLYSDALNTLTDSYADSQAARYWVFFLGQFLAERGRFDEAAEAYAKVVPEHERYAEAVYLAAESVVESLKRFAAEHPTSFREINHRAMSALRLAEAAREQLERSSADADDPPRRATLKQLVARASVLIAETCVVPGVKRWERALDVLDGFEQRVDRAGPLIGRVLRVRMIALEALGRVDEASQLIPRYVASDPDGAIPTLQGLYEALSEEIENDRLAGRDEDAAERAKSAVVIAEGIYRVASEGAGDFDTEDVYALRLQLAEAYLMAERYGPASELFDQCLAEDAERHPDQAPRDSRAIYGGAEALYQLESYDEALPLFNRVFRSAENGSKSWWRALLRDLQCRTRRGDDPARIIQVIQQRKTLDREMGGSVLRRQFDALLAENERRTAQ